MHGQQIKKGRQFKKKAHVHQNTGESCEQKTGPT